jgi:hypothetical protein
LLMSCMTALMSGSGIKCSGARELAVERRVGWGV